MLVQLFWFELVLLDCCDFELCRVWVTSTAPSSSFYLLSPCPCCRYCVRWYIINKHDTLWINISRWDFSDCLTAVVTFWRVNYTVKSANGLLTCICTCHEAMRTGCEQIMSVDDNRANTNVLFGFRKKQVFVLRQSLKPYDGILLQFSYTWQTHMRTSSTEKKNSNVKLVKTLSKKQSESECKCLTCNQKPTGSQFSLLHEPN